MFNYTGLICVVKSYLQINMSFCPIVPDGYVGPSMCPSDHECAKSVLIIDVHVSFIHSSLAVSIGVSPGNQ